MAKTAIAVIAAIVAENKRGESAMKTVERLQNLDRMLEKVVEHAVAARARLAVLAYAEEIGAANGEIDKRIVDVDKALIEAQRAIDDAMMDFYDTYSL
jgi:seryl-tRNA synthetase